MAASRQLILLASMLGLLSLVAAQSADLAPLMAFKAGITNWATVSTSPGFMGWNDDNPCPTAGAGWTGVICAGGTRVTELNFNSKLGATGSLAPELALLTALQRLDLSDNMFTGPLPAAWGAPGAFPALKALFIRFNTLMGTLPPEWGQAGAFPVLEDLDFHSNGLSGSLPPEWGAAGSFPSLLTMIFEKNQLTGPLPASWASGAGLPKIKLFGFLTNSFTGPLPPTWTSTSLNLIELENNKLTGTLPASWAKQFPALTDLTLMNNDLSGPIPNEWGTFPALRNLGLLPGNPGLCGVIPALVAADLAPSAKDPLPLTSDGGRTLPTACGATAAAEAAKSPAAAPAATPAATAAAAVATPAATPAPKAVAIPPVTVPVAVAPAPGPGEALGLAPGTAPFGVSAPGLPSGIAIQSIIGRRLLRA